MGMIIYLQIATIISTIGRITSVSYRKYVALMMIEINTVGSLVLLIRGWNPYWNAEEK